MAGTLLVGAEGVILIPHKTAYASSRPIFPGIQLVMMLRTFRVAVMCHTEDTERADWFCKVNGLTGANVIGMAPEDREVTAAEAQWAMLQRERAKGPIELVLTASQSVYSHCKSTRQEVLLYGRMGSIGPLGDQPTWDDLAAGAVRRAEAVARGPNGSR